MSHYLKKEGLYEKLTIEKDIPTPRYKPYTYTKKEFIDINYETKIPLLFINDTNSSIKVTNNTLQINNNKYDISLLKLKDLLPIFNKNNVDVMPLTGYENFLSLPSFIISDFNNVTVNKIDGDISPLPYKNYLVNNKTIYNINKVINKIDIINLENNTSLDFSEIEGNLFYTIGKNTKVYIKELSTSFYIFGDYNVKQIINGNTIAAISQQISTGDIDNDQNNNT